MDARDAFLNEFRGPTLGEITIQSSAEEVFQNATLRPILKLQNDLILSIFRQHITDHKIPFNDFSAEKKTNTIAKIFNKDTQIQNTLKGIVLGLLTKEEYQFYSQTISSCNKRIKAMLIERLQSQLQLI